MICHREYFLGLDLSPFYFIFLLVSICVFKNLLIHHCICFLLVLSWFRFSERGKIFAKQEVRAIQMGPSGLFFTGDGAGQVRVWQWLAEPTATTR
jgi:hypothetical protein